jgi:hypothetical protein
MKLKKKDEAKRVYTHTHPHTDIGRMRERGGVEKDAVDLFIWRTV